MISPTDSASNAPPAPQSTNVPYSIRLRFRGGQHDGQVVRINSGKCTIGSADHATLRLACAGVHPIHCVILAGSEATAIRSLSPDTLLNGNAFENEPLRPGDILTVGPLQLEVLETGAAEPQTHATPPALGTERLQKLTAELETARQQLAAEQSKNQHITQQLDDLTSQLETETARVARLEAGQSDVESQEATLAALREKADLVEGLVEEKQNLTDQVSQLQLQLEQAQIVQTNYEAEFKVVSEKIAELESAQTAPSQLLQEVEQLRVELERLESQRHDFEARQSDLENELEAARQQSANQAEELQQLHQQLANNDIPHEIVQSPVEQAAPEPDVDITASYDREIPAEENQADIDRAVQGETIVTEADPVTVPEAPSQTMAMDELSNVDSDFTRPAEQPSDSVANDAESIQAGSATMVFESPDDSKDDAMSMLANLRAELGVPADNREDAPQQDEVGPEVTINLATDPVEPANGDSEEEPVASVFDAQPTCPLDPEDIEYSQPASAAPVDTAAILAQFGHSTDDLDLEEPEPAVIPDSAPTISLSDDEEEDGSIQDYMAQLMQRVGGSDAPPPANKPEKPDPAKKPTPQVEKKPVVIQPKPEPKPKPLDPSEFVPRAVAPEATSGLKALRAVANTSTRSAIDRYNRRSLDTKAIISGIIAFVAFGVAVAMGILALDTENLVSIPMLLCLSTGFIGILATVKALAFSARAALSSRRQQNLKQLSAR